MKFFTTYLLLAFSVFAVNAQGNMQFNQVVRTKFTVYDDGNGLDQNTAGTISVPQNKVWKIESGSINHQYRYDEYLREELLVDGQLLYSWIGVYSTNSSGNEIIAPFVFNSAPIWLPSGNYPITFKIGNSNGSNSFIIAISALEFNIVP